MLGLAEILRLKISMSGGGPIPKRTAGPERAVWQLVAGFEAPATGHRGGGSWRPHVSAPVVRPWPTVQQERHTPGMTLKGRKGLRRF